MEKVLFAIAQQGSCATHPNIEKMFGKVCEPVRASNPQEIFQSISSDNPPRVIVLDYVLEESNGFGLCAEIQMKMDGHAHVIMVDFGDTDEKTKQERLAKSLCAEASEFWQIGKINPSCLAKRVHLALKLTAKQEETRMRSARDHLTGDWNRAHLSDTFESFMDRCRRSGEHPVLFMLDIDHFKKINDTYGHQVGDLALKHFSKVVKNAMRKTDQLFRIGGEEFVVLSSVKKPFDGYVLAEKVRRALAQNAFVGENETEEIYVETEEGTAKKVAFPVTASIGQVIIRENETLEEAKERADQLLYQAKHNGRNRVMSDQPMRKHVAVKKPRAETGSNKVAAA